MGNVPRSNLKASLRQLVVSRNPKTQSAIMMMAVDLCLHENIDPGVAIDRVCEVWDATLLRAGKGKPLTWAAEERIAAAWIAQKRRDGSGWKEILEKGTH